MSDHTTTNPASILGGMAHRREEIIQASTKDLPVPRWTDPEVFVRFRPVDHGLIRKGQVAVDKATDRDKAKREVEVNSDVLVAGCVGVYALIDGTEYSLRPDDFEGEMTRFDADLAANLGLDNPETATARQVVKGLYMFDGDILSTAGAVIRFSGYVEKEATERVSGE